MIHKLFKVATVSFLLASSLSVHALWAETFVSGSAHPGILVEEHILNEGLIELQEEADIHVSFDGASPEKAIRIDALNFDSRSGRFAGRFVLNSSENIILRGRVEATLSVLLPSRRVSAGEIITSEDVSRSTMPVSSMSSNMLRSDRDIIGKEARRTLMPGRPISENSLIEPRIILRGDEITINYADSDLNLSVPGRALEDGAINQRLRVVNLQSSKTITAHVAAPGVVIVKPASSLTIIND